MSTPHKAFFQNYSLKTSLENGLLDLQEWLNNREPYEDQTNDVNLECISIICNTIINKYMAKQGLEWCSHYLQLIEQRINTFRDEFLAANPYSYGGLTDLPDQGKQ